MTQNACKGCAGAAGEEVTMNAAAGRAPYLAPSVRRLDVSGTEAIKGLTFPTESHAMSVPYDIS